LKKAILIFTVLFTFLLSSVSFASCNLDLRRWQWVSSTDEFGVYFDIQTLKYVNNVAEVWQCFHFPHSCDLHPNVGEHYHYCLYYIYYNNNTIGVKSYLYRDSNGRVLKSDTFQYVDPVPIIPDSIGEEVAIAVRKRLTRRY